MSTQGVARLHSPPTTQITFQEPENSTVSGRKTPSNFSLFGRPSNSFSISDRNYLQSPTPSQKSSASGLKRATSWLKGRFNTKPTKS